MIASAITNKRNAPLVRSNHQEDWMKPVYKVMAMVGDFVLEHQPFWDDDFSELAAAKGAARKTWELLKSDTRAKYENFQVSVLSDDGETVNYLIDLSGDEFFDNDASDRSDELTGW